MCIREFPTLVEKVKMVETLEKGDNIIIKSHKGGSASGKTRARLQSLMLDLHNLEWE